MRKQINFKGDNLTGNCLCNVFLLAPSGKKKIQLLYVQEQKKEEKDEESKAKNMLVKQPATLKSTEKLKTHSLCFGFFFWGWVVLYKFTIFAFIPLTTTEVIIVVLIVPYTILVIQ